MGVVGVGLAIWYWRRGAFNPKTDNPGGDSAKPPQQAPIQNDPALNLEADKVQAQPNQAAIEVNQRIQLVKDKPDIQVIP